MKQVLLCRLCAKPISKPILIFDEASGYRKGGKGRLRLRAPKGSNYSEVILRYEAEQPISPIGTGINAETLLYPNEGHPLNFKPQFYLTLEDILETVYKNEHWYMQCCGAGVSGKPNRSCSCGNPVGFELSECFTERVFIPNNETTQWQTVKS